MCGRFVQKAPANQMRAAFDLQGINPNFTERFNVAPTQDVAVIVAGPEGRTFAVKKWGLIPAWSADGKAAFSTINARAETVTEKPAFREAFRQRRCIVPADGFYEWTGEKGAKIPHYFTRRDGALLALAGLHESWRSRENGEVIDTFTLVVTGANDWMSTYHHRMPVILADADIDIWLTAGPGQAAPLMRPAQEDCLTERVVSTRVNSVRNEGADLLEPDPATNDDEVADHPFASGRLF